MMADDQNIYNILQGTLAGQPAPSGSAGPAQSPVDVVVKVDSDMLCLAGALPVVVLAFLLNRLFSKFDGPASNGVTASDLFVKTSLKAPSDRLAATRPSSSAVADNIVPPTVHSGNPADYTVQGYMNKILEGLGDNEFVTLRRATPDEVATAGSPAGSHFIAVWLHVNVDQAARSNLATGTNADISTALESTGSPQRAPSSRPAYRPQSGGLGSFRSLPAGTVAAAARASLAAAAAAAGDGSQTGSPGIGSSNPNVKSNNGRVPNLSDDSEVGKAFGARMGLGNLWGKVGLGRRRAAEVLAVIAPAIQVMREMNKKTFVYDGKDIKLTKKIMIQGLGIADKSFSPMETAFRRGQYLLNVVAEHDLADETNSIDIIGDVFTNSEASTTIEDLYSANDTAHKSIRAAAMAKGLADLADMMNTDWAMGRHTWKITEPRPTYVNHAPISDDLLRDDLAIAVNGGGPADDSMMVGTEGADLLNDLDETQEDLPVDPELMSATKSTRKRAGGPLESSVSKRLA